MKIKLLPKQVSVDGDCTNIENVLLEVVDYGDSYHVQFLKKDEGSLLGKSRYCDIQNIDEAFRKVGELARQTCLPFNQIRFRSIYQSNTLEGSCHE